MMREHGGPDALGVAAWDFSTNANACGPCPATLAAVREADATRYPDPAYMQLRRALAVFHAVDPGRIVMAASASEFIQRLTARVAASGGRRAWWPDCAYGDYAHAAAAWGLARADAPCAADLVWTCEPSSPLGQDEPENLSQALDATATVGATVVLDRAYEPLRLTGACSLGADALARVWQLWSPNKALGLTGIRGAYAIAPLGATSQVQALEARAPSWPLGAHAVAMLHAWTAPATQAWLADSHTRLQAWKVRQSALLGEMGWTVLPSQANFLCARAPQAHRQGPGLAAALRAHGVKLRDTTSLGLPGHWRLGVLPPMAQDALRHALEACA